MFGNHITPYPHERIAFGDHWCGPTTYTPLEETLVAVYASDDDGQSVEVYCCAMPARFYTIKAVAGKNSIGEPIKPFRIGTGSCGEELVRLVAGMAKAISEGMLGLHPESDA